MSRHPDFLVIGPTRSGTTWLNRALSEHPEVWVPYFKELHYFNVQKSKTFNKFYMRHREQFWRRFKKLRSRGQWPPRDEAIWWARYFLLPRNDAWYLRLFPELREPIRARGECSPKYCLLPDEGIQHILHMNAEIKIVYILRNPIDRAWSILARRHGRKLERSLDSYTESEIETFFAHIGDEHRLLNKTCIERWRRWVAPQRFYIAWFDDLQRNPIEFLRPLAQFLDIDEARFHENSDLHIKRNATSDQRPTKLFPRANRRMAEWYMDDIRYVASSLGGYGIQWLEQAKALTALEVDKFFPEDG